jgi:hypothetical protein
MLNIDLYCRDRSKNPYLLGDLFTNNADKEFTLFYINENGVFGVMNTEQGAYLKRYPSIDALFGEGFNICQEHLEEDQRIAEEFGLFAPRKLEDGTWAALTQLVSTTAICVNYDADGLGISMYESRYCFSHNQVMPSPVTAVYWLSQFKNRMSLPVGNCAYRGRKGTDPIWDADRTETFYELMDALKCRGDIEGHNIHTLGDITMREVLKPFIPKHLHVDHYPSVPK